MVNHLLFKFVVRCMAVDQFHGKENSLVTGCMHPLSKQVQNKEDASVVVVSQ